MKTCFPELHCGRQAPNVGIKEFKDLKRIEKLVFENLVWNNVLHFAYVKELEYLTDRRLAILVLLKRFY